jgi:hypothetical protein
LFSDAQEVKKGDTCTDPGCYEAKKEALVQLKIAEAQRQVAPPPPAAAAKPATLPPGVKPLGAGYSSSAALAAAGAGVTATPKKSEPPVQIQKISTLREDQMPKGAEKKDVLYADDYNVVKPGCKQETKAIWVDGIHIGKITAICITEGCKNHGYSSGGGGGSRDPITFERKKEIWEQKVQYVYRDELLKLIATKLPGKIGDQEAALVAEHIMKTLPHHGHEKVGRVFGLKEADPESLELHMRKLKGDALMRFIVVCALVEDLGTGEVAWGGELDKESALKIAAKAYKIDDQKLLDAAKAQLESKRPKTEKEKAAKASKQPDNKAVVERANKAKQKSKPAKKKAKGKK